MADEESQVEEETSWWAFEGFADSELPSMSIDEPLEWPDSLPWEEFSATSAPADTPPAPPVAPVDLVFPTDVEAEPAAEPDSEWQAGGHDPDATMAATPLGGLGGGAPALAPPPPPVDDGTAVQPMPESIWSFDGVDDSDDQVAGLATLAAPLVYADGDRRGQSRWPRQLDIRRGNVAVVALISAVSLVLLGMFLSVRSRNNLPTDATASPPRTDQIATANTRNPQPPTSAATTTTVAGPVINIADLVPPADGAAAATGTGTGAAGGGAGAGTGSATTAPARSTAAPAGNTGGGGGGGGGSTATTQPAPQSTATTAAPEPPAPEPPTPTAPPPPPVDDTPNTTRPRTPAPTFTVPTFPDVTAPSPGTSIPNGFPTVPTPSIPRNDS